MQGSVHETLDHTSNSVLEVANRCEEKTGIEGAKRCAFENIELRKEPEWDIQEEWIDKINRWVIEILPKIDSFPAE